MTAVEKLEKLKELSGLSWDKLATLLGYANRHSILRSKDKLKISKNAEISIDLWLLFMHGEDMNKLYEKRLNKLK